jgi:hypothetical protein
VNDIFVMLGVESWKPALGALLLPPTPFALMVLAGGVVMLAADLLAESCCSPVRSAHGSCAPRWLARR